MYFLLVDCCRTVHLMMSLRTLHPAKSVPLNSQCIWATSVSVDDLKSQVKAALDPTVAVRL